MSPRARATLLAPVLVTCAIAAVVACDDGALTATPCTDIPAGGCPLAHGVACEDPACDAVYACLPGNQWELRARCPARDGAVGDASPVVVADAEAVLPRDASVDAPPGAFGGPGCPSLGAPDCPLGVALACGAGCCGCEDLYVCSNGGWDLWGVCGDGGVPVSSP